MGKTLKTIRSLVNALYVCRSALISPVVAYQHTAMGRTNERIARVQETYTANATTSWLESLERSLAQMKEYQVCWFP